jgi:hypothetical protein
MALKDFHGFFLGRMGPAGNELEVREVVRLMAGQLHDRYPAHILAPEDYLRLSNGDKYAPRVLPVDPLPPPPRACLPGQGVVVDFLAQTRLTEQGRRVLGALNINTATQDCESWVA